ncbi:hypothetical protein [Bermanella sp. R86510]|uniref:hypothetical protein n=1 Tax=unclassified Bermanella TaxID=2627862 RepID=UPI0037CC7A33
MLVEIESDTYFGMSRDGKGLALYDLTVNNLVEGWPLNRWSEELKDQAVSDMYRIQNDPKYAQEYSHSPFQSFDPNFQQPPVMGCYSEAPLRYGDMDEDGKNEVVLFLGHKDEVLDLVLFSPEHEAIEFSVRLILSDATDFDYGERFEYQYATNHYMNKTARPGKHIFAKVFIGEFDGNENKKDILVWRKHYRSLPKSSSKKGFELVRDHYQFYTQADKGYKLQISLETQIQQWLSENNLTWQKGFPSKSECKGQEGELIPEMHDPLLNDPDVVK